MNRARSIVAVAAALLWSNRILPRLGLGIRGRTVANAGFATGYALALRGRPNWLSGSGFRYGCGCAAVVAAGYAAALAVPSVRERLAEFADRGPEVDPVEWAAVHIPVGTVYSEELIFRATLDPLLDSAFGPRAGIVLGALTFGFWHVQPARSAGDSVPATVAATTAGGFVLGLLRRHTDSTTAPALLHFAINAGGVIAARLARNLPN